MIDIRKLKELVRLMVSSGLTELDLRDSEEQVTLRRHLTSAPGASLGPVMPSMPVMMPHGAGMGVEPGESMNGEDAPDAGLHRIESPMVGTFFVAGQPEAPAFVTAGSTVSPETVVCIIEAMKIFNEIKAECSGTIRKVMVKNGEAVEFGQPLFLVDPA